MQAALREASLGSLPPTPQGPLQAFGSLQRALRETDKRVSGVNNELFTVASSVDGKIADTSSRLQRDCNELRAETRETVADLEELVLQMYDEHEREIRDHHSRFGALHAEMQAQQAAQQAAHVQAITAQQAQIESLKAALASQQELLEKQKELLERHVETTQTQLQRATELVLGQAKALGYRNTEDMRKAFNKQGEALEAAEKHIGAVRSSLQEFIKVSMEKNIEQAVVTVTERHAAAERRAAERESRVDQTLASLASHVGTVMAWGPELKLREIESSRWRHENGERLDRIEGRVDEAKGAALAALAAEKGALEERVERVRAELVASSESEVRGARGARSAHEAGSGAGSGVAGRGAERGPPSHRHLNAVSPQVRSLEQRCESGFSRLQQMYGAQALALDKLETVTSADERHRTAMEQLAQLAQKKLDASGITALTEGIEKLSARRAHPRARPGASAS